MVSVNRWDEETDVIVAGCGLSGAAAATKYLIAISGGGVMRASPVTLLKT